MYVYTAILYHIIISYTETTVLQRAGGPTPGVPILVKGFKLYSFQSQDMDALQCIIITTTIIIIIIIITAIIISTINNNNKGSAQPPGAGLEARRRHLFS